MFLRPVRTTQPQGPARIDRSNPITRGLEVVVNGADKSTYSPTFGTPGVTATRRGLSPLLNGGCVYQTRETKKASPEMTLFSLTSRTGAGTSSMTALAGFGDFEFSFADISVRYSNQTTFRYEVQDKDGAFGSNAIFSGLGLGEELTTCFVLSSPRNFARHYKSGVPVADNTTGGFTNLLYGPVVSLSTGLEFTGSIPLFLIFSRALSDAEVKSLSDNPWQIFASDSKALWSPAAVSVTLPTLVRPTSTVSPGLWAPTGAETLHETIDEEFHEFADYMSVSAASTAELELAEAAFPGGANQTLAYWASSTQGSTLTVTLKQGATQIMSRTHALTATDTLYTQTLTAPEIALITAGAIQVTLTTS